MNLIITYLFLYNQYLLKVISQSLMFISKYIPLKQWAFDDSHSQKYQKFKVDKLPKIFNPEPALIDSNPQIIPTAFFISHFTLLSKVLIILS